MEVKDLQDWLAFLETCCLHDRQWQSSDVAEVLLHREEINDERTGITVVRLNDGGFGLLTSSCDYTGHGCQCGSSTARADTLTELLRHVTEDELLDLVRSLRAVS